MVKIFENLKDNIENTFEEIVKLFLIIISIVFFQMILETIFKLFIDKPSFFIAIELSISILSKIVIGLLSFYFIIFLSILFFSKRGFFTQLINKL